MKRKSTAFICNMILIMLCLLFMFPLMATISNSLMTPNEISVNYTSAYSIFDVIDGLENKFINISLVPDEISFEQYKEVLINQPSFLILMTNSMKITLPVVIGNVIVSLMTAYGFTVWRFKYKELVFLIYVVVMLMPLQAVLVPNYIIADKLGIKDSYLAIILPGIFSPFGTFLLRQNLKSMPKEYFEAAQIDGANEFYIFANIVIPQMKSGMAALFMLMFIEYWNLVEQSIIFIKDYFREPLSVFLSRISQNNIAIIFAVSCVYMFLPFWFLVMGQKHLEKGIELSGIK